MDTTTTTAPQGITKECVTNDKSINAKQQNVKAGDDVICIENEANQTESVKLSHESVAGVDDGIEENNVLVDGDDKVLSRRHSNSSEENGDGHPSLRRMTPQTTITVRADIEDCGNDGRHADGEDDGA